MNIIKLNAIDSTNSYLKQLARETSVSDKTVVITESQLEGRGQMGNKWQSETGQSLTFSMLKCFQNLRGDEQFMISMAVSLSIVEVFDALNIPNVSIKWPNDILSDNKKIGGILIENVLEGSNIKYTIIGIGMNVNENSFNNLPQASSLKLQSGITFNLDEVFHNTTHKVFKELQNVSTQEFKTLKHRYENRLFRKGKISVFENPEGERFNGIINGISSIGELVVEIENGSHQYFQMKQVKLIY